MLFADNTVCHFSLHSELNKSCTSFSFTSFPHLVIKRVCSKYCVCVCVKEVGNVPTFLCETERKRAVFQMCVKWKMERTCFRV